MNLDLLYAIAPQIVGALAFTALAVMEFAMPERGRLARCGFIAIALVGAGAAIWSAAQEYSEKRAAMSAITEEGRFAYLEAREDDLRKGKSQIRFGLRSNGYLSFVKIWPTPLGVFDPENPDYFKYRDKGGRLEDLGAGYHPLTLELPPDKFTFDMQTKDTRIIQKTEIVPFEDGWAEFTEVRVDGELVHSGVRPNRAKGAQ